MNHCDQDDRDKEPENPPLPRQDDEREENTTHNHRERRAVGEPVEKDGDARQRKHRRDFVEEFDYFVHGGVPRLKDIALVAPSCARSFSSSAALVASTVMSVATSWRVSCSSCPTASTASVFACMAVSSAVVVVLVCSIGANDSPWSSFIWLCAVASAWP